MSFNSAIYIYVYLPVMLAGYFVLYKFPKLQNFWLLGMSFVFYSWCSAKSVLFLAAFCGVNYVAALLMRGSGVWRKLVFLGGVLFNLACLYYVKYLNFTIDTMNALLSSELARVRIVLAPLGLSFLVFTAISYLADVYRGKCLALVNPIDEALYLSFFPKVSQGPITRMNQMEQLQGRRRVTSGDFAQGLRRFCIGLGKKVLIADVLGATVDLVFAEVGYGISASVAWAGILCFTFQLYFDFSGYTDMAIGVARMLGFDLPENFNAPYHAKSVSEFWRRWHITLGAWFREYVYIPLGGNRKGRLRQIVNLSVVWLLTGIWHGASFTYILWGLFMGFFVILEKLIEKRPYYLRTPDSVKWASVFLLVVFSWVLFRSEDLTQASAYFAAMFGANIGAHTAFGLRYFMDNGTLLALGAAICISVVQPYWKAHPLPETNKVLLLKNAGTLLLLAVSLLFVVNSTYSAFIYAQF